MEPRIQGLSKYLQLFNRFATRIACVALLVMTGLVTADVIVRRVLDFPILFADEVSGYLLVAVTFLGLGHTLKEGGHTQVRIFVDRLSPGKHVVLRIFWYVIGIIYVTIIVYMTSELTWESYKLRAFSPTPSQIILFPFQIVMPIGCLIFLLQMVAELIESVSSLTTPKHTSK